ncbi:MAG: SDR family oxidoreductase [Candidatus Dormibacteraceae bacterium]
MDKSEPLATFAGLVTGAASGIGAATVHRLVAAGARVVAADLHLPDDSRENRGDDVGIVSVRCDVRQFRDVESAADLCLATYGRIDFVVASAGIADTTSMADGDPDRWRLVLETNILGVFHAVRGALPAMQRAGRGHVVLVSSLSGRESYVGEAVYIASKWAVVGFGNSLRKEASPFGVKVTLVEPGLVDTPMARANPFAKPLFDAFDALQPEDIAEAIAYVLSQPPNVLVRELAIQPLGQNL